MILGALPLFHAFGQTCALNTAIALGLDVRAGSAVQPGQGARTIERDRVTVFAGVPTMFSALLHDPDRDRVRRRARSGSASPVAPRCPVEILRGFEEAFGCIILEGYGLSETSPVACFSRPDRERKVGSIGTPIEGVEMRARR